MSKAVFRLKFLFYKNEFWKCEPKIGIQSIYSQNRKYCKKGSTEDASLHHQTKEESKTKDDQIKLKNEASSEKQEAAKKKLMMLLSEMKVETGTKVKPTLNLSKPLKRPLKKERFREFYEKQKNPEDKLQTAAVAAAASVPGDPSKTLAELNRKLAALNMAKAPMPDDEGTALDDGSKVANIMDTDVEQRMMSSVKDVASAVVDDGLVSEKSVPPGEMRRRSAKSVSSLPHQNIDDLLKGMKVEKTSKATPPPILLKTPVSQLKPVSQMKPAQPRFISQKIDIHNSPPLDIFPSDMVQKTDIQPRSVWRRLEDKQLRLMVQFAPTNAFEEMMMLTEQGKHWKFPIDNQTEMGEEENVGFHEHVFLEKHLHVFPTKGPIRHFMELVCVGLSKNPYITVERKIENINWFRDYFADKEDILNEYGVLEN